MKNREGKKYDLTDINMNSNNEDESNQSFDPFFISSIQIPASALEKEKDQRS